MWRNLTALVLALVLPASASAGPLIDAAEKAARERGRADGQDQGRSRHRFWSGMALVIGGGTLAALSGLELGDDETGPDDGEDSDDSDDGEDADGWGGKAMLAGGVAAATLGAFLVITGRDSGPTLSIRPGRVMVRHTLRF